MTCDLEGQGLRSADNSVFLTLDSSDKRWDPRESLKPSVRFYANGAEISQLESNISAQGASGGY